LSRTMLIWAKAISVSIWLFLKMMAILTDICVGYDT
jgi:hypothetical protein